MGVFSAGRSERRSQLLEADLFGTRRGGSPPRFPYLAVPGAGKRRGRGKMVGSVGQEGVWASRGLTFTGRSE